MAISTVHDIGDPRRRIRNYPMFGGCYSADAEGRKNRYIGASFSTASSERQRFAILSSRVCGSRRVELMHSPIWEACGEALFSGVLTSRYIFHLIT